MTAPSIPVEKAEAPKLTRFFERLASLFVARHYAHGKLPQHEDNARRLELDALFRSMTSAEQKIAPWFAVNLPSDSAAER